MCCCRTPSSVAVTEHLFLAGTEMERKREREREATRVDPMQTEIFHVLYYGDFTLLQWIQARESGDSPQQPPHKACAKKIARSCRRIHASNRLQIAAGRDLAQERKRKNNADTNTRPVFYARAGLSLSLSLLRPSCGGKRWTPQTRTS